MQLEVGKYYKTRDGSKVGQIRWSLTGGFVCPKGNIYCHDGTHGDAFDGENSIIRNRPEDDLIEEWKDEPSPVTLSTETIDHIAIDSLMYHNKGNLEPSQREAFRIVLAYYGVNV